MDFIGTILIGPYEVHLEKALLSFHRVGVDAIHGLIDTLDNASYKLCEKYGVRLFERRWDWNFGKARTYLAGTVPAGTRMEIFLDCDDEIDEQSAERIREIIASGYQGIVECNYQYIENGVRTYNLKRFRLYPPEGTWWKYSCHEVPIFSRNWDFISRSDIDVLHHWIPNEKTRNDRYIEGLLNDLKEYPGDSRVLHYLGQTYYEMDNHEKGKYYYEEYLKTGLGWDEERLKACLALSNMARVRGDLDEALAYAMRASAEVGNNRREPLQVIGEIYMAKGDLMRAAQVFEQELSIQYPVAARLHVIESYYKGLPEFWLSHIKYLLNDYVGAYTMLQRALSLLPNDEWGLANLPVFEQKAKEQLTSVGKRTVEQVSSDRDYWINKVRANNKLIYMWLGPAPEPWTADDINTRGVGGRETATVRIAQELKKYGWEPIIYGDCENAEGMHDGLMHRHFIRLEQDCKQNIPVAITTSFSPVIVDWTPEESVKVCWVHDAIFSNYYDDWFHLSLERYNKFDAIVFQSPSHKRLNQEAYPYIKDDKIAIIGLAVDKKRFQHDIKKDRYKVVYTSSPDRGLERLLKIWVAVKQRVPEATLHIYYGFDNMKQMNRDLDWVNYMENLIKETSGVIYHGRIGQEKLALELLEASIWAYPTHFFETFCISAIEASAAGCALLTTKFGALETTVGKYGIMLERHWDSPEYFEEFKSQLIKLLTDDEYWRYWSSQARENFYNHFDEVSREYWSWERAGQRWNELLEGLVNKRMALYGAQARNADDRLSDVNIEFTDKYDENTPELHLRAFGTFLRDYYGQKPLVGIELGVYDAVHAKSFLDNLNIARIYLVDPYEAYDDYFDHAKHVLDGIKDYARDLLSSYGDKVVWIYKMSDNAVLDIPEQVDFVYIDANHKKEYIIRDFENYYKLVKPGGIIGGHDYDEIVTEDTIIEGKQAVDEISRRYGKIYVTRNRYAEWWHIKETSVKEDNDHVSLDLNELSLMQLYDQFAPGENRMIRISSDILIHIARSHLAQAGFSVSGVVKGKDFNLYNIKRLIYGKEHFVQALKEITKIDHIVYPNALYSDYWGEISPTRHGNRTEPLSYDVIINRDVRNCDYSLVFISYKGDEVVNIIFNKWLSLASLLNIQFVYVDDGSDAVNESAYKADILIRCHNRFGRVEAFNLGLQYATGNKIIISCNDSFIPADIIDKMNNILNIRHDIGAISPSWKDVPYIGYMDGDVCIFYEPYSLWNPVLYGQSLMLRYNEIKLLGYYDRLLYNNWEDHDLTRVYQEYGMKVAFLSGDYGEKYDNKAVIVNYSNYQKIRRILSMFYFMLKWGYEVSHERYIDTIKYYYMAISSSSYHL